MLQKLLFTFLPMAMVAFVLVGDLPAVEHFEGTILEVTENQVTVHDYQSGEYLTFIVKAETEITLDGMRVSIFDLLPYVEVTVVAVHDGQDWFAQSMNATSVGSARNSGRH